MRLLRLRKLLRLHRWAVVARRGTHGFERWSWHLTHRGADKRLEYYRMIDATRDVPLWLWPGPMAADLPVGRPK
jgi:hypothetical protein